MRSCVRRRGSLFYETSNATRVGDIFVALVCAAEFNGVDPFEYMVTLQRHMKEVAARPDDWLPWNYRATLAALTFQ